MKVARAQSAGESRGFPGKCEQFPRNRGLQNGEVPDERTHGRTDGRRTDARAEQRPSESLRVRSQTSKADAHSAAAPPRFCFHERDANANVNVNTNANANADRTRHVRARGLAPRRFHANVNFSRSAARTQNSSTSLLSRGQHKSEKLCKSPVTNERTKTKTKHLSQNSHKPTQKRKDTKTQSPVTNERTKTKHLSQSELTQAHAKAQRHKAPEPE